VLAVLVPLGRSTVAGYDDYNRTSKTLLLNRRLRAVLNNNDMYAFVSEPFVALGMVAGRFSQCIELLDAVGDDRSARIRLYWEERFTVMACNAKTFEQIENEFIGCGYGKFKPVVGEAVVEHLRPIREESMKLMKDKAYLESVYRDGAQKASYVAEKTLRKVYKKVGFVAK
jgi:hypothetical protein